MWCFSPKLGESYWLDTSKHSRLGSRGIRPRNDLKRHHTLRGAIFVFFEGVKTVSQSMLLTEILSGEVMLVWYAVNGTSTLAMYDVRPVHQCGHWSAGNFIYIVNKHSNLKQNLVKDYSHSLYLSENRHSGRRINEFDSINKHLGITCLSLNTYEILWTSFIVKLSFALETYLLHKNRFSLTRNLLLSM